MATVRSGDAQVRVNMRTGKFYSRPPDIQFEAKAYQQTFSLEDSIYTIEQAIARGEMRRTGFTKVGLARLHEMLTQEEERGLKPSAECSSG